MTIPPTAPRKPFDPSLLTPPYAYPAPPPPELGQETLSKLEKITRYFSADEFELPIKESTSDGAKRGLSEREMMFLVRGFSALCS